MLGDPVAVVKSTVTRCVYAVCNLARRLLKPAPTKVVSGIIQDFALTKSELVADNAMLRQQLIVARRAKKRPVLHGADRLFMVLLARLNRSWRAASCPERLRPVLRGFASASRPATTHTSSGGPRRTPYSRQRRSSRQGRINSDTRRTAP